MGGNDETWGRRWGIRRHPRWMLAVKTAVAATLAWLVIQPFSGFTDQYPYYAPLGAVVAMSTTVMSSVRASWQAAAAVLLGGAIALTVQVVPAVPTPVELAAAILVATLVAGSPLLGAMGGWVPTAAVFALLLGHEHPVDYVAAYAGLIAFGALVGVGVNAALPQLSITPAALAAEQLRQEVADQLEDLAEGLAREDWLTHDDWAARSRALGHHSRRVDELIARVREGQRANWRSRRFATLADRQYRLADATIRLSDCVDDVANLVGDERATVHADDAFSADLRRALAAAMEDVAVLLREAEPGEGTESLERAESAVRRVRELLARAPGDSPHHLAAAAITVSLHRAVTAWT